MVIKAKLKCDSVTKLPKMENVVLTAVTSHDSEENKTFSKFTPSAKFELCITNEDVFGHFEPGKEYYIDILAVADKSL